MARIETDARSFREMRARGVEDAGRESVRIARLDMHLEPAGVELAGEQEVVDDVSQAGGLFDDDLEELPVHGLLELEVLARERQRRAVDRGERRAQLM